MRWSDCWVRVCVRVRVQVWARAVAVERLFRVVMASRQVNARNLALTLTPTLNRNLTRILITLTLTRNDNPNL